MVSQDERNNNLEALKANAERGLLLVGETLVKLRAVLKWAKANKVENPLIQQYREMFRGLKTIQSINEKDFDAANNEPEKISDHYQFIANEIDEFFERYNDEFFYQLSCQDTVNVNSWISSLEGAKKDFQKISENMLAAVKQHRAQDIVSPESIQGMSNEITTLPSLSKLPILEKDQLSLDSLTANKYQILANFQQSNREQIETVSPEFHRQKAVVLDSAQKQFQTNQQILAKVSAPVASGDRELHNFYQELRAIQKDLIAIQKSCQSSYGDWWNNRGDNKAIIMAATIKASQAIETTIEEFTRYRTLKIGEKHESPLVDIELEKTKLSSSRFGLFSNKSAMMKQLDKLDTLMKKAEVVTERIANQTNKH